MAREMDPLRRVRQVDYEWIEMPDGARLAARVWLPDDAADDPAPGILEAAPYRLSDGMATRDVLIHPWWAARTHPRGRRPTRRCRAGRRVRTRSHALPTRGG